MKKGLSVSEKHSIDIEQSLSGGNLPPVPPQNAIRDSASRQEGRHTKPTPVYPAGPWCFRELTLLKDADGRHIVWVDRLEAFHLVRSDQVTVLWSGKHPRYLQHRFALIERYETGSAERHTRYSHNRAVSETYIGDDGRLKHRHYLDANVEKCWTLKHLDNSTGPIFDAAWLSVLKSHATSTEPPANDGRREHRDNVVCIRRPGSVGDPRRAGEVQNRAA